MENMTARFLLFTLLLTHDGNYLEQPEMDGTKQEDNNPQTVLDV